MSKYGTHNTHCSNNPCPRIVKKWPKFTYNLQAKTWSMIFFLIFFFQCCTIGLASQEGEQDFRKCLNIFETSFWNVTKLNFKSDSKCGEVFSNLVCNDVKKKFSLKNNNSPIHQIFLHFTMVMSSIIYTTHDSILPYMITWKLSCHDTHHCFEQPKQRRRHFHWVTNIATNKF
jgi:hypothetical protein